MAKHGVTLDQARRSPRRRWTPASSSTQQAASSGVAASSRAASGSGSEHVQPIVTPEDLANVTIVAEDGRIIRLSDVAVLAEAISR